MSELRPHSSFLFSVSCKDTGLVSVTHLGTMTLPGKQLTAVSLKVGGGTVVLKIPKVLCNTTKYLQ